MCDLVLGLDTVRQLREQVSLMPLVVLAFHLTRLFVVKQNTHAHTHFLQFVQAAITTKVTVHQTYSVELAVH